MTIDLKKPTSGGWEGSGLMRHYVWTYTCLDCGEKVRVYCSSWIGIDAERKGITPRPAPGAIRCPHCESDRVSSLEELRV